MWLLRCLGGWLLVWLKRTICSHFCFQCELNYMIFVSNHPRFATCHTRSVNNHSFVDRGSTTPQQPIEKQQTNVLASLCWLGTVVGCWRGGSLRALAQKVAPRGGFGYQVNKNVPSARGLWARGCCHFKITRSSFRSRSRELFAAMREVLCGAFVITFARSFLTSRQGLERTWMSTTFATAHNIVVVNKNEHLPPECLR
jgi:hypothetical protein